MKTLKNQLSGMPQMSAAFGGWKIKISLLKITQTVTSGLVTETSAKVDVQGTWQPLSPQAIQLKPDDQRSWEWIDLHVEGNAMVFKTNDRITRDGVRYKVMASLDYTLNNFSEYHLVRDFPAGGA